MRVVGTAAALLLALVVGAACASLPLASPEAARRAQSFEPAPGRARLYVLCRSSGSEVFPVVVNGRVLGGLSWDTYLMVDLDPGTYAIASHTGESVARLELAVQPGGIYFVRVFRRQGLWDLLGVRGTRVGLRRLDEMAGRRAVTDSRLVESTALH